MKILIVDDHAVIHQGLKRILDDEFEGATFGEARHSQEALDLVSRERWDLVILDVDLPGRGGLDVLKQMRTEHSSVRQWLVDCRVGSSSVRLTASSRLCFF